MSEVAKKQDTTPSGRFMDLVVKEYQASSGQLEMTPEQKRRVQNYFLKLDLVLSEAESKRLSKPESNRDPLEFSWKNINLEQYASNVAVYATLGLDPLMPNHVNLIPYKNGKTNKFDIGFIRGYKGLEVVARNFTVEPIVDIVCELVYSNDQFDMFKKDADTAVESYRFKVVNPFDRGELIGGFIYKNYQNKELNQIEVMTVAEIEKRKPKYASAEFWGGEKTVYKGGKPAGTEKVEGWYKEMCEKTLKRKGWGSITIDGSKITPTLESLMKTESGSEVALNAQTTVDAEIIEEKPKAIAAAPVTVEILAKQPQAEPVTASGAIDFPESM